MNSPCAILIGDLIASTAASPADIAATMQVLQDAAAELGAGTYFTRFRGDGWQIYLQDPGKCLAACLFLQARLRGLAPLSSRIAVGIGAADMPKTADLSQAMGPAFTLAGHALDNMPPGQLLAFDGDTITVSRFEKLAFQFTEDRIARWSRDQARAMALAMAPKPTPRAEIASLLGVTRQAINARLIAAGYNLLNDARNAFFNHYHSRFHMYSDGRMDYAEDANV